MVQFFDLHLQGGSTLIFGGAKCLTSDATFQSTK